ncbi:MAG: hypothetical protein HC906_14855 [Bacteroidales bacterium]|nr:hypothetical protein [Bacteroidales bacterium]
MKTINVFLIVFLAIVMNISCVAQSNNDEKSTNVLKADKIEVLYFHFSRRCATCNAVESVSKEAVAELYGNKVTFACFNLDEEIGQSKGKELEVSGQTLLIVAGDTKINITNEGFLNARNNPEKLKAIIKEKIDPLL